MQLVHLAYQDEQWLLWLEGEPSEQEDKETPFGGSEKDLKEFWSRFWQSEEDAETTESLFWPSPNLQNYTFYLNYPNRSVGKILALLVFSALALCVGKNRKC